MKGKKFATCLCCIDGRTQLPVIHWIKKNCKVDYVDMITEPGIDGILNDECFNIDDILLKINLSIEKHGANIICVVGHYDCAGNQVDDETHKSNIRMAAQRLKELNSFCQIIGLWISNKWVIENIIKL